MIARRDREDRSGCCLITAPRVDYDDFDSYVVRYAAMQEAYTLLIEQAVLLRQTSPFRRAGSRSWPFFSQRDLLLVGLAEFPDLCTKGLACILKLTGNRGMRFCKFLNESIIGAVTTSCRTYVNTISGLRLLHENIRVAVDYRMMTGLMVDSMFRVSGQCETHTGLLGTNLFDANFVQWCTDESCVNIARKTLPECMLAVAMLGHSRLGETRLNDDTLRLVCALLV